MGNRNAKPAFNRFQDVPSNKQKNNTSNLQEQADSMKKLESIKTPGQSSVGNLRETSKQNSNPTQRPPKQASQHMKEWKEATEKLNKQKNDEFIEKNYGGGMEKYKADEAKQNADRKRMQEGQAKLKESTKRYDNLFNGNNSEGGPPQIAKE